MRLTTRCRYGVRLMIDLATFYAEGPISLKEIAKRQDISEKYLWQLMSPLMKAGFVNSIRGSKGGYFLAKDPQDIRLSDMVSALEGPLDLVKCVSDKNYCKHMNSCNMYGVWSKISSRIIDLFDEITLATIIEENKMKRSILNYDI